MFVDQNYPDIYTSQCLIIIAFGVMVLLSTLKYIVIAIYLLAGVYLIGSL